MNVLIANPRDIDGFIKELKKYQVNSFPAVNTLYNALVQHPDGWYWLADSGRQQFGPYASADEALAEMAAAGEETIEPGETLNEAEDELGIADWLDPETGELAEGTHTRIEDH